MNIYTTPPTITPEVAERARQVQEYAFANRESAVSFNNRMSTFAPGPRDKVEHRLDVPVGYKAIYSIIQDVTGWNQIIEISVARPKMSPSPGQLAPFLRSLASCQLQETSAVSWARPRRSRSIPCPTSKT